MKKLTAQTELQKASKQTNWRALQIKGSARQLLIVSAELSTHIKVEDLRRIEKAIQLVENILNFTNNLQYTEFKDAHIDKRIIASVLAEDSKLRDLS